MKHLLVLMAVLGLSFSQIGCGGDAAKDSKDKKPAASEKKPADDEKKPADDEKKPAE